MVLAAARAIASAQYLVDVIEPPTYEVLESLITGVEKLYG